MGTRGGVSSNEVDECDFGLGLRMQTKQSCIPMSPHNELSPSSSSTSSLSGDFGGEPMFYSRNNRVGCFGDIYDVVGSGSSSATKSLQFSSGETAQSVSMRVSFTVSQWQELERQNIIFKYLMASVPVPPELLIPILRTQSSTSKVSKGSSLELGILGSNLNPEPWRCRRTDGKKWRCTRDAATGQKYCERHSHKNRPRSRKPVELHSQSANLLNPKSQFCSQTNSNFSIFSSYDQLPRNLEWFLKGETETVPVTSCNLNSCQEWHPMKTESTRCGEKMYSFESRGGSQSLQTHRLNDNCSLLLSPKVGSLSQTQAQETRHFLDVWSSALRDGSNVGGIGDEKTLLPASLSLSMGGEEVENGEGGGCASRPPSQWMSHGSCFGSTPGGPLAEALCLGISSVAKDGGSYGNTSGIDSQTYL